MLTCKMSYCVQSVRQNISCPRCYFYHIKCKKCYFYNIKWCTFSTWRALGCDKYFAARDFKLSEKLPHLTLTFEKNAKFFFFGIFLCFRMWFWLNLPLCGSYPFSIGHPINPYMDDYIRISLPLENCTSRFHSESLFSRKDFFQPMKIRQNALKDVTFSHFQLLVADGKVVSNYTQQCASDK